MIKATRNQMNMYPKYYPRVNAKLIPMTLNKFEPVLAEDITSIIKSMVSKSCELDVVPTTLIKDILLHIIDTLAKITNASEEQDVFTVRPILKKLALS